MADLPFNENWVRSFVDFRLNNQWLEPIGIFITDLGDEMFYIALIGFVYWNINKKKANTVIFTLLAGFFANFILKVAIANPRPFEGTPDEELWAVEVSDPSTPSGHAMNSAAFWTGMYFQFKKQPMLIVAIVMTFLVGLSRPFLGVHFFEDVILGWILGILVALLALRLIEPLSTFIINLPRNVFLGMSIIVPTLLWVIVGILMNFGENAELFTNMAGVSAGLFLGYDFESRKVRFEAQGKNFVNMIIRYILGVIVVFAALIGLDILFAFLAEDTTFFGHLLRFIRYFTVGFSAYALVPFLYVQFGLADTEQGNEI